MYITNDIAVASYLMMRGLSLKDAFISQSGKYVFELEDPQGVANKLSIEFLNSDCSKFDNQMRNLRKILKIR